MKNITFKAIAVVVSLAACSCMTTYDAHGRQVQTVDPGAAAVGVAAAGIVGYAIGKNNGRHHHHGGHYYRRPYYGPYCY